MMIDLNDGSSDEDIKHVGIDVEDASSDSQRDGQMMGRGKPERVASDFFGDENGFLHIGKQYKTMRFEDGDN